MDSPLILPAFYVDPEWDCYSEFVAFIVKLFHTYDNTNIFLNRPNEFEEGGRVQNEEESKAIDEQIKSFMFHVAKSEMTEVDADRNVASNIIEIIEKRLP